MKILGFNLTKINVEKFKDKVENLKINTQIDVAEISEVKSDFFKTKEEILAVKFTYGLNYEPEFAKLEFSGNIVLSLDSKTAKNVLKQWKDKKMPEDFRLPLFNIILRKSSLKALQLEEDMNLPIHMQLPSLRAQDKKE